MRRTLTVVTLSLLLLCGGLARAESMRCGNRLVGVGDPSVQLRARCGAPDHIEVRDIVRTVGVSAPSVGVVGPGAANGARVVVSQPPVRQRVTQRETIEVWTYRGDGRSLARHDPSAVRGPGSYDPDRGGTHPNGADDVSDLDMVGRTAAG
ncbi:MAG: DUF2845 domain-containing protein, partial [Myxococcota bacterium]